MIAIATIVILLAVLAWAAARCPLGRALGLGMNCLAA